MNESLWNGMIIGETSPGCKSCHLGRSTVIFVTGLCNATCYYCPVSEGRMFKPQSYANEKAISSIQELIDEVKLCKSEAASLTGGDPLLDFEKCFLFSKGLKEEFGHKFYIHLYTPGREGNKEIFKKISPFIDEIRFHPKNLIDIEKMVLAFQYDWNIGIEIPATPGLHKTNFFQNYVDQYNVNSIKFNKKFPFININELEISERNFSKLRKRKLVSESNPNPVGTYVDGSRDEALKIINLIHGKYPAINVHYCPASQKDSIQLPNRLLNRAHSIMLPSDFVIEDWTEVGSSKGLLIRGVIRINEKIPVDELDKIRKKLIEFFNIPDDQIHLDLQKNQILTRADFLEEFAEEIKINFPNLIPGMVEEYPTDDRIETSFYKF